MNKPIYRHLADKKWRSYKRQVLVQRITQMNVIPDILDALDPVVSTQLMFGRRKVPHGEIVDSRVSEIAPFLNIQPYDQGERLYTIAVIDPDVPNVEKDGYDFRCHYLASNIRISPTETMVRLGDLSEETQIILPWLAPYSQKGLPYQRLAVVILEQTPREPTAEAATGPRSQEIDVAKIKATKSGTTARYTKRDGFILKSFATTQKLTPVGADLFRTVYDEGTAGVMERAGIVGGNVEFKRMRVEPLPYKRLKGSRYR
jgi:large subunit ribosomal protein L35